jgi:methylmalonyl-CoA carboxyltransferase large subunit
VAVNGAELMIAVVLVVAGCGLTYLVLQRKVGRAVSDLQRLTERQLNGLIGTVKTLETRVAELSQSPAMRPAVVPVPAATAKLEVPSPVAQGAVPREEEEVTPEMLVVIAAAVTAFLGKKVRIRSAKMLQSPYEIVNPWSQQGRVRVQASHNLRSRG